VFLCLPAIGPVRKETADEETFGPAIGAEQAFCDWAQGAKTPAGMKYRAKGGFMRNTFLHCTGPEEARLT